jgi:hypothetical protein
VSILIIWTAALFFQINEINTDVVILPVFSFWEFVNAAHTGIPFTLYLSVLLGLSYTARKKIRIIPSIVVIFLLAVGWTVLFAWATAHIPPHPYVSRTSVSLARDGLIMTAENGQKSVFPSAASPLPSAASEGMLEPDKTPQMPSPAKPLSFKSDRIFFIQNISKDFLHLAENFDQLRETGFVNFTLYAAGLVVLLVSMRFIMDLSVWALANLFLGFIAFSGIFTFELFINSTSFHRLLLSLVTDGISTSLINPLILCVAGLFVMGVNGVVYSIKKKGRNE